jgi:hypothetical protein
MRTKATRNKERGGGDGVGRGAKDGRGLRKLKMRCCNVQTLRDNARTTSPPLLLVRILYARRLSHLLLFTLVDLHDDDFFYFLFFTIATSVLHHLLYCTRGSLFNTAFNHIKGNTTPPPPKKKPVPSHSPSDHVLLYFEKKI